MRNRLTTFGILATGFFLLCNTPSFAQAPSLSLKEGIQVAEEALGLAKVDANAYFLYSVTYSHSAKGDYWYCTFKPVAQGLKEIFVKVYVDKSTEISGAVSAGGPYR